MLPSIPRSLDSLAEDYLAMRGEATRAEEEGEDVVLYPSSARSSQSSQASAGSYIHPIHVHTVYCDAACFAQEANTTMSGTAQQAIQDDDLTLITDTVPGLSQQEDTLPHTTDSFTQALMERLQYCATSPYTRHDSPPMPSPDRPEGIALFDYHPPSLASPAPQPSSPEEADPLFPITFLLPPEHPENAQDTCDTQTGSGRLSPTDPLSPIIKLYLTPSDLEPEGHDDDLGELGIQGGYLSDTTSSTSSGYDASARQTGSPVLLQVYPPSEEDSRGVATLAPTPTGIQGRFMNDTTAQSSPGYWTQGLQAGTPVLTQVFNSLPEERPIGIALGQTHRRRLPPPPVPPPVPAPVPAEEQEESPNIVAPVPRYPAQRINSFLNLSTSSSSCSSSESGEQIVPQNTVEAQPESDDRLRSMIESIIRKQLALERKISQCTSRWFNYLNSTNPLAAETEFLLAESTALRASVQTLRKSVSAYRSGDHIRFLQKGYEGERMTYEALERRCELLRERCERGRGMNLLLVECLRARLEVEGGLRGLLDEIEGSA